MDPGVEEGDEDGGDGHGGEADGVGGRALRLGLGRRVGVVVVVLLAWNDEALNTPIRGAG